jgi:hypothetical protein
MFILGKSSGELYGLVPNLNPCETEFLLITE